jgi:hypothetical protein
MKTTLLGLIYLMNCNSEIATSASARPPRNDGIFVVATS